MKTSQKKITQKSLIENSGHINPLLIKSVIKQFGGWGDFTRSAPDVTNNGIDGGFSGWIYYSETHEFTIKNRKLIVELLNETADQLGEDVVAMVVSFGVFRNSAIDIEDKKDLYTLLGGGKPAQGTITNVMAWFAAETVCRAYNDLTEQ